MIEMTATVARDVTIAGRRYTAGEGDTVVADRRDVGRLRAFGFAYAGEPDPTYALDGLTVAELREVAADRQIVGRSRMTREELVEALSTRAEEA